MADIWMDVDAALSEVPVNILPLLDDSDFKTRLTSVAYNASGMDLVWNFVTPAGAFTQTAVTPTTSGNYDWAHQGDGMYSIEVPASGGASINNDTEGFGWFTGIATGVLPWRGPIIGFRAAGLNDALIESAWSATRGLAGTALPAAAADAAGGLPISDAGGLDLDAQIGADIDAILVDTGTTLDGRLPAALVSGRIDASVGAMAANVITATAINADAITAAKIADGAIDAATFAASAITSTVLAADAITAAKLHADVTTELQSGLATAAELAKVPKSDGTSTWNATAAAQLQSEANDALVANHLDHLLAVTYDPASKPGVSDALLNELIESDSGVSRYTANALEQAPTGGSAPSAADIADAVWDETLAGHAGAGSSGEALSAAGSAGDPWITDLPGSYTGNQAGKVLADVLVDTGTTLQGEVDGIQADTEDIQARLPAALVGGRIDANIGAISTDATAADNAEAFFDGTGYAGTNNVIPTVTTLTNAPSDSAGVTTLLTRVTAAVALASTFTGITSLAQWLGLITGKQTGNSTARTEVRATGAGSGTYDETTDSQEATRDNMGSGQTGDAFARLGAPAGASVSADIAAVKSDTGTTLTRIGTPSNLGGGATVAQNLSDIEAQTDDIGASGAGLTALASAANLATVDTVVDSIMALLANTRAEPGQGAPAATTDPLTKLDFIYKLARNKITQDATTLKVFADDGTTVDHKAPVSDDGSLYSRGEIVSGP